MTPSAPPIGAFLWLLVILFSLMLYVVLDGYDLGVGVLLLFCIEAPAEMISTNTATASKTGRAHSPQQSAYKSIC